MTVPLRRPSSDTAVIVAAALAGLAAIYKAGYRYAKAGIMLLALQLNSMKQERRTPGYATRWDDVPVARA
jgi:DNA polymerase V